MAKLLTTQIAPLVLHFKPGQTPPTFSVQVVNQSDTFATFQLEVLAAGVEAQASRSWYQQSPDLSAKIPPGDRTQFAVTVLDVPPVRGGFVGSMTLTVRVFSVELRQEDRQVLTLVIEGSGIIPPQIDILSPQLVVVPQSRMEIPVRLYNPNRSALRVNLSVQGLPPEWLTDGQERRLEVPAQGEVMTTFLGHIESPLDAPSQVYPFDLEARVTALVSQRFSSQLTVLPAGTVEMDLTTPVVVYPSAKPPRRRQHSPTPDEGKQPMSETWLGLPMTAMGQRLGQRSQSGPQDNPGERGVASTAGAPTSTAAAIGLTLNNHSNLPQVMTPVVERIRLGSWFEGGDDRVQPLFPTDRIALPKDPIDLPIGAVVPITLPVAVSRPWLGWTRTHLFRISALRPDQQIPLEPDHQTVTVRAQPKLHWGLQLALLGAAFGLLLWLRLLPPSHRGAVNMVRFDGRASEVLSASEDQTVRRWAVAGQRLQRWKRPLQKDKAVRVARYRPVGNDAIAVGYENGATEIIPLRVSQPPLVLAHDLGDRVFDLQFTPDAQTLFTGYGSGALRRWDLSGLPRGDLQPVQGANVGFAVQTLALIPNHQLLVGGRFNRLAIWDWAEDRVIPFPYLASGGDQDYITSLATAAERPHRLAIADNQGRISLWDLQTCPPTGALTGPCRPLYTWADGHGDEAVRALAITDSGCALVSGGDDGHVKLWEIQADGSVVSERRLGQSRQAIDTVDVILRDNRLLAVSGGRNHRVKLYTAPIPATCR
jgi:WD40 repeat protein